MTHTETTRESACHLEQASRCLASLANAMSEATDEEGKRRITDAICHALSNVARATALVKPVSTLCWQRKRIEPSAPRYGLFPNISVCLGERRGKKAISNSRERNVPAPALTQAHPQQRSHAMGSAKKRIE